MIAAAPVSADRDWEARRAELRRDIARAALALGAALCEADPEAALEWGSREIAGLGELWALEGEARRLVGFAEAESVLRRMADGLAGRSRALRLLGNGVHPLAAAHAWRALSAAHGLRPLDLDRAGDAAGDAALPLRGAGMTPAPWEQR